MNSYEQGKQWEEELARRVGGTRVPGSGNTWHSKLDVRDATVLWSAKSTTEDFYRLDGDVVREAAAAARGPGSSGLRWALALRIGTVGRFVVMGIDDFLSLLEDPNVTYQPDKHAELRRRAHTPQLLREDPNA